MSRMIWPGSSRPVMPTGRTSRPRSKSLRRVLPAALDDGDGAPAIFGMKAMVVSLRDRSVKTLASEALGEHLCRDGRPFPSGAREPIGRANGYRARRGAHREGRIS